jgi:hypothetical protein
VAATAAQLVAANHLGTGQPTRDEWTRATAEMIGVIAASVLPPSQSFAFSCRGMNLQQDTDRLARCLGAAEGIERADTFIVEGLGLSLQNRLLQPDSPQGRAVTERRRILQYRLEQYSRIDISSSRLDELPSDLIEAFRTHDREQDIALAYFTKAGIAPNPPPGWSSTQLPRVP